MSPARFSWSHPAVYPLFGAMALGVGVMLYSTSHHLFSNPDVRLSRAVRADPMMDNDATQQRIAAYRSGSIFRRAAESRSQGGDMPNVRIF